MKGDYIRESADVDRLPFLALSEPERLKRVKNARDNLAKLHQRFDDRLYCKGRTLAEEYNRSNAFVAVFFDWKGEGADKAGSLTSQLYTWPGSGVLVAVYDRYSPKDGSRKRCDDQLVFVDIIQGDELPNLKLPSRVRLYFLKDNFRNFRTGLTYQSIFSGFFHTLPFPTSGELGIFMGTNRVRHVIERASEIVNRVTNDERHLWRELLDLIDPQDIASLKSMLIL